jgi:hypothetical protein
MSLLRFEKRWADAAVRGIYPVREGARVNVPYERVDIGASFDETLEIVPFRAGVGLRIAIWMIALSPLFVIGRLATIASLAAADRDRVLSKLIASPTYLVRQITLLFKAFGALFVFRDLGLREDVLRRGERLAQLGKKKETHHAVA